MKVPGPQLRDIHPPTVSWWPPAWGWWLLAALLVVVVVVLGIWITRRVKRRRSLGAIARSIEQARARYHRDGDDAVLASTLSQWLRRAGRLHAPQAERLQGESWHAFLHEHAPPDSDIGALRKLDVAMYRPGTKLDDAAVTTAVLAWVRHALAGS